MSGSVASGTPSIMQNKKYKRKNNIKLIYLTFIRCTNNIKLIYLTFIHCTNKQITELNWYWTLQTITKMVTESGKARHVMCTRVLRRPIVFLRVRCSIPSLLIKTVDCSIVRCSIPHCTCWYSEEKCPNLEDGSTVFFFLNVKSVPYGTASRASRLLRYRTASSILMYSKSP